MKYKIRDLQFDYRYFADGAIFDDKNEILEQLASYHDIDYEGVKDDGKDTPYEDIYEFLATLKNDEERLNWILDYGQWKVEEVPDYDKYKEIITKFIEYYTGKKTKERKEMKEALGAFLKGGELFY